ncbi:hypothetical protein J1614_008828 [Plenodomus biglobosus]|nr:hypothetical protein J1614_008828 [Plenodomus biglobosus]
MGDFVPESSQQKPNPSVVPGSWMPRLQYGMIAMSHSEDIPIMQNQPHLMVRPLDMTLNAETRNQLQSHYQPQLKQVDEEYRRLMQENYLLYLDHLEGHKHETMRILSEYWVEVRFYLDKEAAELKAAQDQCPRGNTPPSHVYLSAHVRASERWSNSRESLWQFPGIDISRIEVEPEGMEQNLDGQGVSQKSRDFQENQAEQDRRSFQILFGNS